MPDSIYDESLLDATLSFTIAGPGTLRYQIDDTASYANAAAMDAAAGSAQVTGSVAAPVGNGTEVIDTSALTSGTWYIHLVRRDAGGVDGEVSSTAFTKVTNADILVTAGSLVLTANAATVAFDRTVNAAAASLTLTANPAAVVFGVNVNAAAASLSLTANAASVALDKVVAAQTASLTLTSYPASVALDGDTVVAASLATLNLTTYAATVAAGGGAFHPSDLFPANGAVYEPLSTFLFTDSVGGTNVTGGDAVAAWEDQSGNAVHASQGTASARPMFNVGEYLEHDGTEDRLQLTLPADDYDVFLCINMPIGAADTIFLGQAAGTSIYGATAINGNSSGQPAGTTHYLDGALIGSGAPNRDVLYDTLADGTNHIYEIRGVTLPNLPVQIMGRNGATFISATDLGPCVFIESATVTSTDRTDLLNWLAAEWGVTL